MDNYFLQNYKICKYFLQNLLRKVFYTKYFAKKLAAISCKRFFITKFISIFYKKNFETKLVGNMSFFSSESSWSLELFSYKGTWSPRKKCKKTVKKMKVNEREWENCLWLAKWMCGWMILFIITEFLSYIPSNYNLVN